MFWTWKDPELWNCPLWGISVSENLFNLCWTGWWRNEEKKTSAPVFFSVPIWRSLSRFPCPKNIKTHLIEPAICNRLPSIYACQMTYHPHKSELLPRRCAAFDFHLLFPPVCLFISWFNTFFWRWLDICEGKKKNHNTHDINSKKSAPGSVWSSRARLQL